MAEDQRGSAPRISRRELIGGALAGGAALGAGAAPAWARVTEPAEAAAAASTLTVGFCSPRTGPLAGFGEPDPYVLGLARKALAGGLTIAGRKYAVTIVDVDTQSDPVRAGQLAKTLINRNKIDLMLATSTPEVVNPVADACEAAGVPCLSTIVPWEAWYFGRGAKPGKPSPFKWTYHFCFGTEEFAKTYLSQWKAISTNKKVAVMWPNDADGNAIRAALGPLLQKGGYTIVDPGAYEDGTTDYSSQIAKFKSEGCEIFNTFPIPPDFATFWRQAAQQGFRPKIVQIAKTGLFASQLEALGSLGYNIASACYWHPTFPYSSKLTGVNGKQLAAGYEKAKGKQWNQQLGATMSLLDAGVAALHSSTDPKSKAAVAKALSKLKVGTMVGQVDFTSGPVKNVSAAPIIGDQWVKATSGKWKLDLVVTDHATDPKVPIKAKLQEYA